MQVGPGLTFHPTTRDSRNSTLVHNIGPKIPPYPTSPWQDAERARQQQWEAGRRVLLDQIEEFEARRQEGQELREREAALIKQVRAAAILRVHVMLCVVCGSVWGRAG